MASTGSSADAAPEGTGESSVPRVLIADQDPATIERIGACGTRVGWALSTAACGPRVIDALRDRSFDVVVADLCMPGIDGLSLLRQIRSVAPAQPVILVSASGSLTDFVAFLREGVTDVLQKPIDADALARAVSRAVSSARERERSDAVYRHVVSEETHFSFSSRELSEVRPTLGILDRLFAARQIDVSSKLKIELAFQEILANALEHGNLELESRWKEDFDANGIDRFSLIKQERLAEKMYAERSVRVAVSYSNRTLSVSVRDEGKGFIPKVPEEWKSGAVVPHGRGLAMIFAAADSVEYSDGGRCVTIVKRFSGC